MRRTGRRPAGTTADEENRWRSATLRREAWFAELEGRVDTSVLTAVWEDALRTPLWNRPPVWIHGDLDAQNLLMTDGRLTGAIDFGCLAVGDPACDVMVAWKLLTRAGSGGIPLEAFHRRRHMGAQPGMGRVPGGGCHRLLHRGQPPGARPRRPALGGRAQRGLTGRQALGGNQEHPALESETDGAAHLGAVRVSRQGPQRGERRRPALADGEPLLGELGHGGP